ncbi:hypothetical protein QJS10_CPB13g01471 [Acorus calamus]|uniref:Late embryogenesis abundant protein LEA-2 subgroup domain-containing protein n=1 Tax=Acorus calamus TaxID=4465 RepID=A0AAV9DGG3_ACOCL|nr:hypothetical protein QJS10_CPB13g01471 [Acorus calamus]
MADTKQPIPNRRRRHHCGPCCGCLLCSLFMILLTVIVLIGIAVLVLWLVVRPNKIKVYVTDANLSKFDLSNSTTNSNSLNYNLSMVITIRNPNRRVGIYYDFVEGRAFYDGERIGYDELPTFYQGHKNTTTLRPAFEGRSVAIGAGGLARYRTEKGVGIYNLDVEIHTRVRFRVAGITTNKYSPKATCHLSLPVGATAGGGFSTTRCDM